MLPDSRRCTKCKAVKSLSEFSKAPRGKWGRKASCKACDAARHAAQFVPKVPDEEVKRTRYTQHKDGPKRCTDCGVTKDRSEFSKSKDGKYGPILRSTCKACSSASALQWHWDNPGRTVANRRKRNLASLYGLSMAQFDAMLRGQGGVCAICGKAAAGAHARDRRLVVDHCHERGEVRGLLCHRCNRALGLFGDDPILMRKAISYLLRRKKGAAIQGGQ